jgi:hypothetical protein
VPPAQSSTCPRGNGVFKERHTDMLRKIAGKVNGKLLPRQDALQLQINNNGEVIAGDL